MSGSAPALHENDVRHFIHPEHDWPESDNGCEHEIIADWMHSFNDACDEAIDRVIDRHGLSGMLSMPRHKLRSKGIKERHIFALKALRQAIRITLRRRIETRPLMSNCNAVTDYVFSHLAHNETESFHILYLSASNHLMHEETFSLSDPLQVAVSPASIVRVCLEVGAVGLIVAHNHPSGNLDPSRGDIILTRSLQEACSVLKIHLHDHLIISRRGITSLKAEGYIGRPSSLCELPR